MANENAGQKKNETFDKPDPKVAVRKETKQSLVIIGGLLIVAALGLAALNWSIGSETKETTPASTTPTAKASTTTKKTTSGPTEGLLTAIIGSGAALIIVGFLYGRISSIKLPGGVEVGLTPEEKEKGTKETIEKLPQNANAETVAEAIQATQYHMLRTKADLQAKTGITKLSGTDIQSVAAKVVEKMGL
ncbi:MAG TPA: hypothetical protein VFJ64_05860 [Solirubrobacterales bacterium]|nr:hypothetical protein [Solirubrobacterales bacterium]